MAKSREQILKELAELNLSNETSVPVCKTCLLSKTTSAGNYVTELSLNLHDYLDKTIRVRKSLTLQTNNKNKALREMHSIELEVNKLLNDKFNQLGKHDLIETMLKWMEQKYKQGDWREQTYNNNKYRFKLIERYFTDNPISVEDTKPEHIMNFISNSLANGRANSKQGKNSLSKRTVNDALALLKQFFSDAVIAGVVSLSPCSEIKVSKTKQSKINNDNITKELWLDKEQFNKLIDWIDEQDNDIFTKFKDILYITVILGVRREELLGLSWNNVDFDKRTICIRETLVRNGSVDMLTNDAKTNSSFRTYPMSDRIYNTLYNMRERQIKKNIYNRSGRVFIWEDGQNKGKSYRTDYITKTFKKLVVRCPYVDSDLHFHLLRHSCASILIEDGWSLEDVQHWLGHKDSEVTKAIYVHYKNEINKSKVEQLNRLF